MHHSTKTNQPTNHQDILLFPSTLPILRFPWLLLTLPNLIEYLLLLVLFIIIVHLEAVRLREMRHVLVTDVFVEGIFAFVLGWDGGGIMQEGE